MKKLLAALTVLAMVLSACGGSDSDDSGGDTGSDAPSGLVGDVTAGGEVFDATCVSCHGPDAMGVEGLGTDLTSNEFVSGQSEDELVAFLKVGRSAGDPDNESGVDMPPKGGNPSLTDQDLHDVAAYIQNLPGN